jgi:hypothetical protein
MNDDDGPKIADTFYEYLFKDCSQTQAPQASLISAQQPKCSILL